MKEVWLHERQCHICGKLIFPSKDWVYKLPGDAKSRVRYYCSYKCWRKDGGGFGERKLKPDDYKY